MYYKSRGILDCFEKEQANSHSRGFSNVGITVLMGNKIELQGARPARLLAPLSLILPVSV